jgi:hypothetical protein
MQNISIHLEDEAGKVIEEFSINFATVTAFLWKADDAASKYPWLSTIDPYGDTLFNSLQVPFVVKELEMLQKDSDEEMGKIISESIKVLRKVENDVHTYIRFIGD